MKNHRNDNNDVDLYDESVMNYIFSDSEWKLILNKYEKHRSELSPLVRCNVSKLIHSMSTSKTITTIRQANLLISLLLYKEDIQEYEDAEQTISHKDSAEIKALDDDYKLMRIYEIVEQLQLLIIQYQAHENYKIICQDLVHGRR